jgi:cytochrome bd-type quinol oxidase subunit 2
LTAAPTSNLCSTGTASSVTGSGPWTWSCGETCGTATCSATLSTTTTGNVGVGTTTSATGVIIPTELAGLPTNTNLVKGIVTNIANWLLSIIGIIAVISFIISGIQYFLVATDEKMLETAKKTMMTSIIGIVVALFGYIAVKTVEMLLNG